MNKIFRQKLLLTTALLAVLLISGASFLLIPIAHAATISTTQEQTNSILNSVLGINPSAYSTQINSQNNTQDNTLPQNQIDFTLISNQSSVRVSSTFVNNTLNMLYLSGYSGTLAMTQSASTTASQAADFLGNYQTYTGDSFYGTLASTLNGITGGANVTESVGDMTLKVLNSNQATVDYVWTYKDANGITAQSKNVVLSYYNGQLNCFLNNWPLYNVVGTPTLSRQQAITTALAATQNYTYQVSSGNTTSTVSVAGFQVAPESLNDATLSYVNCPNASLARGNNPFTLYPSWYVPLGFDKFYPGDVSGIAVTVWADSGQVGSTELMTADSGLANATQTTSAQATNQSVAKELNQSSITLTAPIMIVILCGGFWFASKKRIFNLTGGKKHFNPMLWGILLCSVIILSATVSAVKADSVFPNSSARIYASLDGTPGYGPQNNYTGSPPQTEDEINAAYWVQGQLDSDFAASNYAAYNDVEGLTTVANIETNAQNDAAYYDHCTVFQYGHMAGIGTAYVDNTGNSINYSEIHNYVGNNRYSLILLWVCCQSEIYNDSSDFGYVGITKMCNAWMNNGIGVNGINGYNIPDTSGQCFISFYGFSPWIGNDTQTFEEQWTPSMKNFIQDFYYNALVAGYDIHDSLNQASISIFNTVYSSSILSNGYNTWWPGGNNYPAPGGNLKRSLNDDGWYPMDFYNNYVNNSMQVFGDSSIKLYQPYVTLNAVDLYNSDNQLSPEFTINSDQGVGTGSYYFNCWNVQSQQEYTISASALPGEIFQYFDYNGNYYYTDPAYIPIYTGGTITACYVEDNDYTIYLSAIDGYTGQQVSPNVYVDGTYVGTAPINIQVPGGYHTITVDPNYGDGFVEFTDNNNQYYDGQSILINSNLWLYAWYGEYNPDSG